MQKGFQMNESLLVFIVVLDELKFLQNVVYGIFMNCKSHHF
jgi:hypothetical protein